MNGSVLERLPYREIWAVDTEFQAPPGQCPKPICLAAIELRSGRTVQLWATDLEMMRHPPFPIDDNALCICFFASAEMGVFAALDWPAPRRLLDLYPEFRLVTNGLGAPAGYGLTGALVAHGLDGADAEHKTAMRAVAIRGWPFSDSERRDLLAYCLDDATATARLAMVMLPGIIDRGLDRALLRGRYGMAVAQMERVGVPVDAVMLEQLRRHWPTMKANLIAEIDHDGIYDGLTFRAAHFEKFLVDRGIPWPRLESGALALDDDTFKEQSKIFPELGPLRQLRAALAELRPNDLAVAGARNRCLLSPFSTLSSRNAPSASRFIFAGPAWIRGLIKPPPGRALIYADWSAAEIGIAAALSGDSALMHAYTTDPYLDFAKRIGLAPADAIKKTHGEIRDRMKVVLLGTNYGMTAFGLGHRLGIPPIEAQLLLDQHRRIYHDFWRWSDGAVDHGMTTGTIETPLGWRYHVTAATRPRTLRNFGAQATCAECMRVAAIALTEAGLTINAPVHDAFLAEADEADAEQVAEAVKETMAKASAAVLGGFCLRSDAETLRDRFADPRGATMWKTVTQLLDRLERGRSNLSQRAPAQQTLPAD